MPPPLPLNGPRLILGAATSAAPSTAALVKMHPRALPSAAPRCARYFSTTKLVSKAQIPPESPKFLTIPPPPQTTLIERPRNKGHLPVPRKVFNLKRSRAAPGSLQDKPDPRLEPDYVDKIMPRSKSEAAGRPAANPFETWRRSVSDNRRAALEEGLKGLHAREKTRVHQQRWTAGKRARQRREAFSAPERRDDVLTRSTVRAATANVTAVALDPLRFKRAAESAERTAGIAAAKSEARVDSLKQLYTVAKDFIVTEAELEKRVNELFNDDFFAKKAPAAWDGEPSKNYWDALGMPLGIMEQVRQFTRVHKQLEGSGSDSSREATRQKLVAEELTGSKI